MNARAVLVIVTELYLCELDRCKEFGLQFHEADDRIRRDPLWPSFVQAVEYADFPETTFIPIALMDLACAEPGEGPTEAECWMLTW